MQTTLRTCDACTKVTPATATVVMGEQQFDVCAMHAQKTRSMFGGIRRRAQQPIINCPDCGAEVRGAVGLRMHRRHRHTAVA